MYTSKSHPFYESSKNLNDMPIVPQYPQTIQNPSGNHYYKESNSKDKYSENYYRTKDSNSKYYPSENKYKRKYESSESYKKHQNISSAVICHSLYC